MAIFKECCQFLQDNATGVWHESYCLINKKEDSFVHTVQRNTIVLRVEFAGAKKSIAFYWFYNEKDAAAFNEYVSFKLRRETHEVIISKRCRLFYDIDLALDEFQKHEIAEKYKLSITETNETEVMEFVAMQLANVLKESTITSLEDHGVDEEESLRNFDWMVTMRNRPLPNDGFKISIHLITNIMAPVKVGAAIIKNVKTEIIHANRRSLDIDHEIADILCGAIDAHPCKFRGSLSLPYGAKTTETGVYHNLIKRDYDIPGQRFFLTIEDAYVIKDLDFSGYRVEDNCDNVHVASSDFVARALAHVSNIPDYCELAWDIKASVVKKSFMYVKRRSASMCSICKRTHDNDNTMFLIFNSQNGMASWRCTHNDDVKAKVFYREEIEAPDVDLDAFCAKFEKKKPKPTKPKDDELDLDSFAAIHSKPKAKVAPSTASVPLKQVTRASKLTPDILKPAETVEYCDESDYSDDDEEEPKDSFDFRI